MSLNKPFDPLTLSVGDAVLVWDSGGWDGGLPVKQVIVRKTATQVVLDSGLRLNRNGRIVGQSTWSRRHADWFDQSLLDDAIRERDIKLKRNKLGAVRWHSMSTEIIDAAYALILSEEKKP